MHSPTKSPLLTDLEMLRRELVDLAFTFEHRGDAEAADLAIATAMRLAEICDRTTAAAGAEHALLEVGIA